MQEAVEHAQATGHVNFQEYKWQYKNRLFCCCKLDYHLVPTDMLLLLDMVGTTLYHSVILTGQTE